MWHADLRPSLLGDSSLEVAVKTIKDSASRADISNFLLEADSLKAVNADGGHVNVLKLVGCALQELPPYIIIEYAANGSLKGYLEYTLKPQRQNVDIGLLFQFAREAASGMAFLAEQQIVHRGQFCFVGEMCC